jgi:DNA polymerase V
MSIGVSVHPLDTIAIPFGPALVDPPALRLPVSATGAVLGFPSPAEDFEDQRIDLNVLLIRNPLSSFLYIAKGWSMILAGICDGDVLVVDRSVRPLNGDVVIATWEGNRPVCKVLQIFPGQIELHSRSPDMLPPIVLLPEIQVEIFAVVSVARQMRRAHGRVGR